MSALELHTKADLHWAAKGLSFLLGATLCVNDVASTLVFLLISAGFVVMQYRSGGIFKVDYRLLIIPGLLVVLRVLGLFTGIIGKATDELIRSIPLLLLPLLFLWAARAIDNRALFKWLFWGIVFGIFVVAAVCFVNVFYQIIENDQPWGYFWRWRYVNFNFTRPFDLHPAYLGLYIVLVVTLTVFTEVVPKKYRIWLLAAMGIILFQLVARNAIIISGILGLIFLIKKANRITQIAVSSVVILLLGVVLFQPSDYLRNKFFTVFFEDAEVVKSNRFNRLEASVNVFKMAPLIGVGPGNDNRYRKAEYLKLEQQVAFDKNYNAHNQFAEYLSTFGLLGLLIFITVLVSLVRYSYSKRMWLLFFLLCAFIFSMLTESMLERSIGIKYFSLLIGCVFYVLTSQQDFTNLFNGNGSQRNNAHGDSIG